MLNTKGVINSAHDIDPRWAYLFYLGISEPLDGRSVKITSIFNTSERTPSMTIYNKDGKYMFKDFSTGNGGDHIDLVRILMGLSYKDSCGKIVEDYNNFVKSGGKFSQPVVKKNKFQVLNHADRNWNNHDAEYWLKFGIVSKKLEKYNVRPLDSFIALLDGYEVTYRFQKCYGYFTNTGELYKIYMPGNKPKFIKVKDHIQGLDQLGKEDVTLIVASLKEVMVIDSLGLQVNLVAPDSENSFFTKDFLDSLPGKKFTMFDDDIAGIKNMKEWKVRLGVDHVYVPTASIGAKDISEYRELTNEQQTKFTLARCIDKKLYETRNSY